MCKACPLIIRKDGSDKNGKELYQTLRSQSKKVAKRFSCCQDAPPDLQAFYADGGGSFSGKPYRYDTGHTTHIWWTIR